VEAGEDPEVVLAEGAEDDSGVEVAGVEEDFVEAAAVIIHTISIC